MPSVAEHYERVLSPVYTWMTGGVESALGIVSSDLRLGWNVQGSAEK